MNGETAIISHWVAAAGYFGLALAISILVRRKAVPAWLAAASAAHAAWASLLAYGIDTGNSLALTLSVGETLRAAVWIVFVAVILHVRWVDEHRNPSASAIAAIAALIGFQLSVDLFAAAGAGVFQALLFVGDVVRVAIAIGGLVLTHNLYISSAPSDKWSLSVLCLALAGLFIYDVNLFTFQLLEPVLGRLFFEARGLANAVLVPLFLLAAVRNRALSFSLSRKAAFQTFALGAIGVYLVAMSLAAYALGLLGGDWSRLLQVVLVFAALVFGAVVLISGRARAWIRVKINKHFFAYKYDYREEWLRFIATVARSGPGYGTLSQRVIEAIAAIIDSPAGALFVRDEGGVYTLSGKWNSHFPGSPAIRFAEEDVQQMREHGRVLEIAGDLKASLPEALRHHPRLWLAVPLAHLEDVPAVVVLEQPRVARDLDWEDFDILRTVGRQAASLIAEERALADLEESRKFEEFNRRFAFIMHDIKNIVSQLSLLARNAEKHADKPEFREDMTATLRGSVTKMKDLLVRLGRESDRDRQAAVFDVRGLAARLCREMSQLGANVKLDADEYPLHVEGDAAKIEQALSHLIQNAIDASSRGTPVSVRLRNEAEGAKLIVEDRGHGMSEEFIAEELFKPFRSTKDGGFGIGAFEARKIIRAEGGRMEVESERGAGSRFIIHFPQAPAQPHDVAAEGGAGAA